QDARLFFHAGIIASQAGQSNEAERWLRKASELSHLLLPSERNELQNVAARGAEKKASVAPNPTRTFSLGPNTARKTQPKTSKTNEENNIPHVARRHGTARGTFNRNGASFQSHGRAADHSRSRSKHHGRLRVRAK